MTFIANDMISVTARIGNKDSVEDMITWSRDKKHPVTFTSDEKYHYSSVVPNANFYNYVLRNPEVVGEKNLSIIRELSEMKFENPIIIKFKVAPDFMNVPLANFECYSLTKNLSKIFGKSNLYSSRVFKIFIFL